MARIPSIESTDDYIYRIRLNKEEEPLNKEEPPRAGTPSNLLVFEDFVTPAGRLHSVDFTVRRDDNPARDIDFQSFDYTADANVAIIRVTFSDRRHIVAEHDYLLTIILRYLTCYKRQTGPFTEHELGRVLINRGW